MRAGRALVHEAAALPARAFAEVQDPVRGADRLLVVLDHDHGVAEVADAGEGREQPLVVALVQADRGLVEDVEDALHAAADLAGQADAVGLAARERRGGAVQGQVADAHRVQEAQARQDLRQQALGHRLLALGSNARAAKAADALPSRGAGRTRRWSGRPGARPGSRGAGARPGSPGRRLRRDRAGGPRRPRRRPVGAAASSVGDASRRRKRSACRRRSESTPGNVAVALEQGLRAPCGAARRTGASSEKPWRWASSSSASRTRRGPWRCQGWMAPSTSDLVSSGITRGGVHVPARAQALAGRAGAVGAVEREGARGSARAGRRRSARRPGAGCRAAPPRLDRDQHHVAGQVQRLLQGEQQPLLRPRPQGQAVDEDLDAVVAARIEGDRARRG